MLVRLRLLAIPTLAVSVASPILAADTAGIVEIDGGRALYVECRGAGTPPVVIVAGAKASAEVRVHRLGARRGPSVAGRDSFRTMYVLADGRRPT